MRFPALDPLWYNLPAWYARSLGIKRQVRSIHRRGGKDVNDFSMTVQDAIQYGGVHYYLFPTRVWAEEVIFKEQFSNNGVTKEFWKWMIPASLKPIKKDKDSCIILPHNGARIQLGGTDDLSFVGKGGKSYTMSEFSLHKPEVTGFIAPILRQSDAGFRANGTLRGKENQLYKMLIANANNPEWFTQWLRPQQTKCYCWVGEGYNINPELLSRVGEIGPNKGRICNVQDDIDSGMISLSLARQEFLNEAETQAYGSYYENELAKCVGEGRMSEMYDPRVPVYTFWDLGGDKNDSDMTTIAFVQMDRNDGHVKIIDYYENSGHLRGHYFNIMQSKPYRYGGHYIPHDGKRSNTWNGEGMAETARRTFSVEMRYIPKTNNLINDIEIVRRDFVNYSFDKVKCSKLIAHVTAYHESETTGRPCHKNNCKICHGASHGADALRMCAMARHLGIVEDYLNQSVEIELDFGMGEEEFIA